jgi:hypothetical protein
MCFKRLYGKLCSQKKLKYLETSAKSGENLKELFEKAEKNY